MHVLAVASEATPLIKTGGLADVVGALPAALARQGLHVTTMLPGYRAVLSALEDAQRLETECLSAAFGPTRLLRGRAGGLSLIVLDAPALFDRPGNPYLGADRVEWPDNGLRFAALGAAAANVASLGGFDAIHAHDWQAGLTGAYLRHGGGSRRRLPLVFSIHNLAFQGRFAPGLFPYLGLPADAFAIDGIEFHGGIGFLKAGLWYADRIVTVSPTYADEITTPEAGMGLDGLLQGRASVLSGILNGIDTDLWDPSNDSQLQARFNLGDPSPRRANRAALCDMMGLNNPDDHPLFAFVGRIAWQKGVDLILDSLPALLETGSVLAILGSGDAALERRVNAAAVAHGGRIAATIGFDERLARLIYGGADIVLVPSRFEPCGLVQLCAMRYGAVPLASRTGGLADTIVDANEAALARHYWGNGLLFNPASPGMLSAAIRRAVRLYDDPMIWSGLVHNALTTDVSWRRSAAAYAALFRSLRD